MRHSLWGVYQHTHPRQSSPRNGVFHTKARCILFPSKPTLAEKDFRQCIQDCRMEKPTFSDLRLIRVSGHWYRWIGIEKQELWFLNQNSCLAATFTAIFNLVYTIVLKSASENICNVSCHWSSFPVVGEPICIKQATQWQLTARTCNASGSPDKSSKTFCQSCIMRWFRSTDVIGSREEKKCNT